MRNPTIWAAGLALLAGPALAQDFETTELADGVFQFRYQAHQALFVVADEGVVAVDPISTAAAVHFADEIRRVAPGRSLLAVVYSHHHADHATGAGVLRDRLGAPNAAVIAHENARPKIVEAADPDLPPPDLTFRERLTLYVGDRPLEFHYLGPSHSDNMIVAYLPRERLAFAVDFVTNDGVGYRQLPDYHFPDFFEALRRLQEIDYTRIAFGHGALGDRSTIDRQIRYYDDLRAAVARAVEQGLTEDQAAEQIRLPDYAGWRGYDDWLPLNVRAMYRWVRDSSEE